MLFAWHYRADEAGRIALPLVGDTGTVALENVEGDEMVRLYIAGQHPYMTHPVGSLYEVRDLLRPTVPARCTVVAVDRDKSTIIVALPRP